MTPDRPDAVGELRSGRSGLTACEVAVSTPADDERVASDPERLSAWRAGWRAGARWQRRRIGDLIERAAKGNVAAEDQLNALVRSPDAGDVD